MPRPAFPLLRMRRLRQTDWIRRMLAETRLSPADLIQPLFIIEGTDCSEPIAAMPGISRLSIDRAIDKAKQAHALGIPCLALFPNTPTKKRSPDGREAINPDNLICRAIRAIKEAVPDIGLICDVALDPYTDHGHDGLLENGVILNDATVDILVQQSLTQAATGCDIIAPSDMMDGRIGAIRKALEAAGYQRTLILSYAAKYASGFYGPFRDAVGSGQHLQGDKRSYQMDSANSDEALREVALDIDEGADMVMIKPAMPYLDIIRRVKDRFTIPVFAYQVSGEYAMLQAASDSGQLAREAVMIESLLSIRRAGSDAILTYFAMEAAEYLQRTG